MQINLAPTRWQIDLTLIISCALFIIQGSVTSQPLAKDQIEFSESSLSAPFSEFADLKKIDVHAHYRYDRNFLIPFLEEMNMQSLLVDVVRTDRGVEKRSWQPYLQMQANYPSYFYLCSGFNAQGIDDPDYAQKIIAHLDLEIKQGARMVKVWKNFGMVHKDQSGEYVQIDDKRLQPIWDFLIEKKIPVIAHIGEPLQAWTPLDSLNPHHGYFKNNPQYHAYLHPEIPRYETIMGARDAWLARNPDLVVVAAHFGSMSHDVAEVAKRLDKFPNLSVEPGARFGDLARQDPSKVRDFFIKYQDRILYGSDLGISEPADDQSEEAQRRNEDFVTSILKLHWKFFSSEGEMLFDSPMVPITIPTTGLALSKSVLSKVYYENAARILAIK